MGWSRGSALLSDIVGVIEQNVTTHVNKVAIYKELIGIFEDADCDTIDEVLSDHSDSAAFREAYNHD